LRKKKVTYVQMMGKQVVHSDSGDLLEI
jgi:hypothetical protein